MKILGAKPMLQTNGPNLVVEYWRNTTECLQLLDDPSFPTILKYIHLGNLYVWTGDNGYQLILFDLVGLDANGGVEEYKPEQSIDDMCYTDINIVGDAGPNETLWLVFEEAEWSLLDIFLNYDLSGYLKSIWSVCEEDAKEKHDNQWALNYLDTETYLNQNIINADISVELSTKGETNESTSNR